MNKPAPSPFDRPTHLRAVASEPVAAVPTAAPEEFEFPEVKEVPFLQFLEEKGVLPALGLATHYSLNEQKISAGQQLGRVMNANLEVAKKVRENGRLAADKSELQTKLRLAEEQAADVPALKKQVEVLTELADSTKKDLRFASDQVLANKDRETALYTANERLEEQLAAMTQTLDRMRADDEPAFPHLEGVDKKGAWSTMPLEAFVDLDGRIFQLLGKRDSACPADRTPVLKAELLTLDGGDKKALAVRGVTPDGAAVEAGVKAFIFEQDGKDVYTEVGPMLNKQGYSPERIVCKNCKSSTVKVLRK